MRRQGLWSEDGPHESSCPCLLKAINTRARHSGKGFSPPSEELRRGRPESRFSGVDYDRFWLKSCRNDGAE
jgi:hypothetical protein